MLSHLREGFSLSSARLRGVDAAYTERRTVCPMLSHLHEGFSLGRARLRGVDAAYMEQRTVCPILSHLREGFSLGGARLRGFRPRAPGPLFVPAVVSRATFFFFRAFSDCPLDFFYGMRHYIAYERNGRIQQHILLQRRAGAGRSADGLGIRGGQQYYCCA